MHQCAFEKYSSIIKEEISMEDYKDMTIITEVPTKFNQEVIAERFDSTCVENNILHSREKTIKTTLIPYEYPSIIKEEISIDDCNDMTIINEIPTKPKSLHSREIRKDGGNSEKTAVTPYEYISIKDEFLIDDYNDMTIFTKVPTKFSQKGIAERLDSTCAEKSTLHSQKYQHKDAKQKHKKLKNTSGSNAHLNLYYCDDCDYKNTRKYNLKGHIMRKHMDDCNFPCFTCAKNYKAKSSLKRHIRTYHQKQPGISCDLCSTICRDKQALYHHKKIHRSSQYKCQICNRKLLSQENLDQHIFTCRTNMANTTCEKCGKVFSSSYYLKIHATTHTGNKPFSCTVCNKSFALRCLLRQHQVTKHHVTIDTGNKPYLCDVCGKFFPQMSSLASHMKINHHEQPVRCDVCNKSFRNSKCLSGHKWTKHNSNNKYMCQICKKRFVSQKSLDQHILWHKNNKCKECGTIFLSRSTLKSHMIRHTGDKPYPCPHCRKSFARKIGLTKHQVVHRKNRTRIVKVRYVCDFCGDTFRRKDMLQCHINLHMRSLRPHISTSTKS